MGYEYDFVFDWMVKKPSPQQQIKSNDEETKDDVNNGGPGSNKAEQNMN